MDSTYLSLVEVVVFKAWVKEKWEEREVERLTRQRPPVQISDQKLIINYWTSALQYDEISLDCWTAEFEGLRGSEQATAITGRDHYDCLPWPPPVWRVTAASLTFSTGWTSTSTPQAD